MSNNIRGYFRRPNRSCPQGHFLNKVGRCQRILSKPKKYGSGGGICAAGMIEQNGSCVSNNGGYRVGGRTRPVPKTIARKRMRRGGIANRRLRKYQYGNQVQNIQCPAGTTRSVDGTCISG